MRNSIIELIKQSASDKGEINLNEKQIEKLSAEIANMKEQRLQDWTKLSIQQKEAWIKEQIMEFNTGDMAELERSVRIGAEALEAITDLKVLTEGKKPINILNVLTKTVTFQIHTKRKQLSNVLIS